MQLSYDYFFVLRVRAYTHTFKGINPLDHQCGNKKKEPLPRFLSNIIDYFLVSVSIRFERALNSYSDISCLILCQCFQFNTNFSQM